MQLFFFRHGIAEDAGPGVSDAQRALTSAGRAQLAQIGRALQRLGVRPATILVSPLVRTAQTAAIIATYTGGALTTAPDLAPGCGFDEFQRLVRGLGGDQAMLVGHAPDMGDLAARSIGAGDGAIKVKKAGLVAIEYRGRFSAGSATLRYALTPEQLELIGATL